MDSNNAPKKNAFFRLYSGCINWFLNWPVVKKMAKRFPKLFQWETVSYIVCGVLTTLTNLCTFALLTGLGIHYQIADVIAIVTSILAAYLMNKFLVFESATHTFAAFFGEFVRFMGSRFITMLIEHYGVVLMVEILCMHAMISKFIIQFVVIVLNYILGKFLVFAKKK